jgi:hypothetical protein
VARNREPIAAVIAPELPRAGTVLEIASGTGEHSAYFADRFPDLLWQPTDPDEDALGSIAAWRDFVGLPNLAPPLRLDAAAPDWPVQTADAIICINMVHISPWSAAEGLMKGAGRSLHAGAPLILYGPYLRSGVETAPSNLAFDASIKARDPHWGLRSVEQVEIEAATNGLRLVRLAEMPANNLTLIFRRD